MALCERSVHEKNKHGFDEQDWSGSNDCLPGPAGCCFNGRPATDLVPPSLPLRLVDPGDRAVRVGGRGGEGGYLVPLRPLCACLSDGGLL